MDGLSFDESGIHTGKALIPWTDLRSLGIRTTSAGPWGEDLFWMFLTRGGLLEIPGAWMTGADLAVVQAQLKGIDNGKIIRAMTSTHERVFRVWHENAELAGWNDARDRARFVALIQRLGGDPEAAGATFERLSTAWGDQSRRYHNQEHLAECMNQLDLARPEGASADVVELALWFHDAVYVAGASDNEEASSQLLLEESNRLRVDRRSVERAQALVRATAHAVSTDEPGPETGLMLDIDFSILASDPVRFLEYEYAIEEEFENFPRLKFEIGRGRFLGSLLARPSIFRTRLFQERYEAVAREQVTALLQSRRYRAFRLTRWLSRPLRRASLQTASG